MVQSWLDKAWSDLETAKLVAATPGMRLDTAIYHCQQAAEKALKGYLTAQDDSIEKTHDIRKLTQRCCVFEPVFSHQITDAVLLTPYATLYRYPGLAAQSQPTATELSEAIHAAQRLLDFVLALLPPETHPH
jgi:HEPN domain-containing protein